MRPRFYIHMGPRSADQVYFMWKGAHIVIFILILGSSSVATSCVYNILAIYDFECIFYAKIFFEDTYEERMVKMNASLIKPVEEPIGNATEVDCAENPDDPSCIEGKPKAKISKEVDWARHIHLRNDSLKGQKNYNNSGFLNLRKTVFSTIYLCDLIFFSPLASMILTIFLIALTAVGGKGGAGDPGDLLPNPWICIYPFLGFCGFMTIFSFISHNLFESGLTLFCNKYYKLTNDMECSSKMDRYNIQFTPEQLGPARPFYSNYFWGSIMLQLTFIFWSLQGLVYISRILFLADFSIYMTRIRLKDDQKAIEPKMAGVVVKMVDIKSKDY